MSPKPNKPFEATTLLLLLLNLVVVVVETEFFRGLCRLIDSHTITTSKMTMWTGEDL